MTIGGLSRQQRRKLARDGANRETPRARSLALAAAASDHHKAGRPLEAVQLYEQALALQPDLGSVRRDLAQVARELGDSFASGGDFGLATNCFGRAVQLLPSSADAHTGLIRALLAQRRAAQALAAAIYAMSQAPSATLQRLLVRCAGSGRLLEEPSGLRALLIRACDEGWARGPDLSLAATNLLLLDPVIRDHRSHSTMAGDVAALASDDLDALAANALLRSHLVSAPLSDATLERVLAGARAQLAQTTIPDRHLALACALAQQCFINEYVFVEDGAAERVRARASAITESLAAGARPPPSLLVAYALDRPLGTLAHAERLLDHRWSEPVARLIAQHVREPAEERKIASAIRALTPIHDSGSARVREQYEEHPYPRWVHATAVEPSDPDAFLARLFPLTYQRRGLHRAEILVAGCGTGQHPITTARRFPQSNVLAIDLSRASLAFAIRKSREIDLSKIVYAQADILELATLGRTFDVIEASGVLHHLENPPSGWRVLVSLLRPGGVLGVGLYSALGRAHVALAREMIAASGLPATHEGILSSRRALRALPADTLARQVIGSADFFTVSGCRDLLFHVQEQPFTLPEIKTLIEASGLRLLGFDADPGLLQRYRQSHPHDQAAIDLASWDEFEHRFRDCFAAMYQFWLQKPL